MIDEKHLGHWCVTPQGGNYAWLCLFIEHLKEAQDYWDGQDFTKDKIKWEWGFSTLSKTNV